MTYSFTICELTTGKVLESAPFTITGELSRVLQGHGEGELSLSVFDPACPPNWRHIILPWRTLILITDEQDNIVSHAIPVDRPRNNPTTVAYPCVTVEAYFQRRYVPTKSFRSTDQAEIARWLAGVCADAAGIPLEFDTPATGRRRDRDYADDENARVYSRLQELAALDDGFNWTVDVEWASADRDRVRYVFRTGYPHLGYRTTSPDHVFDYPGNVTDFDHQEPWSDGDAATHVRAIGDGEGNAKVMSAPVIDRLREAAGWPRLEDRRSFSGVKEQATIDSHAQKMAAQLFGGQNIITVTVREDAGTPLRNLTLGDTARVQIDAPTLTLDEVWVVVGWAIDADSRTYKPTLARLGATNG